MVIHVRHRGDPSRHRGGGPPWPPTVAVANDDIDPDGFHVRHRGDPSRHRGAATEGRPDKLLQRSDSREKACVRVKLWIGDVALAYRVHCDVVDVLL